MSRITFTEQKGRIILIIIIIKYKHERRCQWKRAYGQRVLLEWAAKLQVYLSFEWNLQHWSRKDREDWLATFGMTLWTRYTLTRFRIRVDAGTAFWITEKRQILNDQWAFLTRTGTVFFSFAVLHHMWLCKRSIGTTSSSHTEIIGFCKNFCTTFVFLANLNGADGAPDAWLNLLFLLCTRLISKKLIEIALNLKKNWEFFFLQAGHCAGEHTSLSVSSLLCSMNPVALQNSSSCGFPTHSQLLTNSESESGLNQKLSQMQS